MRNLLLALLVVLALGLAVGFPDAILGHAQTLPGGTYMQCFVLASGGADHSSDPSPAGFAMVGYVRWSDGTGQILECNP